MIDNIWIVVSLLIVLLIVVSFYKKFKQLQRAEAPAASEHITILTDQTFSRIVKEGVSIVDFWAPWCTPCKIVAPIMNEIAEEYNDKVKVCKLNVDENRQTAGKLGIRNIPTVIIFRDGKIAEQFVGVKPKPIYAKALKKLI
jgi:thioredoxin 1